MEKVCKPQIMDTAKGYVKKINNYNQLFKLELVLSRYPQSQEPCFVRDIALPSYREQLNTISKEKTLSNANLLMHIKTGANVTSYPEATLVLQTLKSRSIELQKLNIMSAIEIKNFIIRSLRSLQDGEGKAEFKSISMQILDELPAIMLVSKKNDNFYMGLFLDEIVLLNRNFGVLPKAYTQKLNEFAD
jgi:hypothetical protein